MPDRIQRRRVDHPIIFSAPMIKALLAGRKTETRRILKAAIPSPPAMDAVHPANPLKHPAPYLDSYCNGRRTEANPRRMTDRWCWWTRDDRQCLPTFKVRHVPGDRLWVREAFARVGDNEDDIHACPDLRVHAYYRADSAQPETLRWRSPIHMPRWASRLTLLVREVRVERLQEITEEAAEREGVTCRHHCWGIFDVPDEPWFASTVGPVESFSALWDFIHARDGYGWEANPWCTVTRFDVIRGNIDATTPQEVRDVQG